MESRLRWILVLLTFLGIMARLPQAFMPMGYDHEWNTGHYCGEAYNFQTYGLLEQRPPEWDRQDFQHTQLVGWMIFGLSKFVGFKPYAGRLLMIGFVVGTALVVYAITKELVGGEAALVAYILYLFLPISMKFSYHVQLDQAMTFLLCLGLLFLLRYYRSEGLRHLLGAGVAFSLAILVKLNAAVFSIALSAVALFWVFSGRKEARSCLLILIVAVLSIVPVLVWMWLMSSTFSVDVTSEVMSYSTSGHGKLSLSGLPSFTWKVLDMFGLVLIPALLGLNRLLRRDTSRVTLVYATSFTTFLILFHKHNYYLMPLTVIIAVAASTWFSELRTCKRIKSLLLILLVACSVIHFAIGFVLFKLPSSDFINASDRLEDETMTIYVDSPQMGYYLTVRGVSYRPFSKGSAEEGLYLLMDVSNINWLLEAVPDAKIEKLSGPDAFTGVREWLRRILGISEPYGSTADSFLSNLDLYRVYF